MASETPKNAAKNEEEVWAAQDAVFRSVVERVRAENRETLDRLASYDTSAPYPVESDGPPIRRALRQSEPPPHCSSLSRLRAALAEAERRERDWIDGMRRSTERLEIMIEERTALRSELARKDAALRRYGRHEETCVSLEPDVDEGGRVINDYPCTCKFAAALASHTAED